MKEREEKKQWVLCPWCGSKTRLQIEKIEDVVVGTSIPYNYEKSKF